MLWFQGCNLGRRGCFNPASHDWSGGNEAETSTVAAELLAIRNGIEGVSFSGGEPFQQPAALLGLLQRLSGSRLSTLAFSGYTLTEIQRQPFGPAILS